MKTRCTLKEKGREKDGDRREGRRQKDEPGKKRRRIKMYEW